mmetsp:Transcript_25864/g.66724  ORF Transcript_25864/g.66724 Transcript_25864/m.66724 type:complete len:317 (-) Transcript_25864:8-958(-)
MGLGGLLIVAGCVCGELFSVCVFVFDMLLDIDKEYQGWILGLVGCFCLYLYFLPCVLGGCREPALRKVGAKLARNAHYFCLGQTFCSGLTIFLLLKILPAWNLDKFITTMVGLLSFLAGRLVEFVISSAIVFVFYVLYRLRDKIAEALGLDHVTVVRVSVKDMLPCCGSVQKPFAIYIWKVDGFHSGSWFSANNLFVEVHHGFNQSVSTRVHPQAGPKAEFKARLEMNHNPADSESPMIILVKHQLQIGSQELGRVIIPARHPDSTNTVAGKIDIGAKFGTVRWDDNTFPKAEDVAGSDGRIWYLLRPLDEMVEDP